MCDLKESSNEASYLLLVVLCRIDLSYCSLHHSTFYSHTEVGWNQWNIAKDMLDWKLMLGGSNLNYVLPHISNLPDLVSQSVPFKSFNPFKSYETKKKTSTKQLCR